MGLVKLFNKKTNIFIPIILIIICFFMTINRIPFYDEARAFVFSSFSINELWQITRIEGHPLAWYFILKSINKNINLYPYSILLLNWLFSSFLIIFFWIKSPFSNIIKTLVLLSYPFLCYYLIVARPYCLTILFLFILAHFLKKSTKKPIFYSFLLSVCANITVIGAIGSFGFLLIFIKKIIDKKIENKDLFISILILIFAILFFFLQLNNPQLPDKFETMDILIKNNLIYFFIFPFKDFFNKPILHNIFQLFSFLLFYASIYIFFKKDKQTLLFLFSTYLLLTVTFLNIYCGGCWHHFFYFIFFIISLWITWDKIKNTKPYKYLITFFLFLTIFPIFYFEKNEISVLKETQYYMPILNRILNDDELKNSKLFCFEKNSYLTPGLIPYFKKHNIYLYDIQGLKWGSFDSYINTYSKKNINTDKLGNFVIHLDKNKNNYLLVNNLANTNIPKFISIDNQSYQINLKMIDIIEKSIFAIYKIEIETK